MGKRERKPLEEPAVANDDADEGEKSAKPDADAEEKPTKPAPAKKAKGSKGRVAAKKRDAAEKGHADEEPAATLKSSFSQVVFDKQTYEVQHGPKGGEFVVIDCSKHFLPPNDCEFTQPKKYIRCLEDLSKKYGFSFRKIA